MNKTEAKLKELGLPIKVMLNKYKYKIIICGEWVEFDRDGDRLEFATEKAAYNWIAKEFHLDNLVSKDKVRKELFKKLANKNHTFSQGSDDLEWHNMYINKILDEIFEGE